MPSHLSGRRLKFVPICESEYPIGPVAQIWGLVLQLRGLAAFQYWGDHIHPTFLERTLKRLPAALENAHVDALVIDPAYAFVELAAIKMGLPYVQAWLVLNFDVSGSTPPNLFSWPLEKSAEATSRNLEGVTQVVDLFLAPSLPIVRSFAEKRAPS